MKNAVKSSSELPDYGSLDRERCLRRAAEGIPALIRFEDRNDKLLGLMLEKGNAHIAVVNLPTALVGIKLQRDIIGAPSYFHMTKEELRAFARGILEIFKDEEG